MLQQNKGGFITHFSTGLMTFGNKAINLESFANLCLCKGSTFKKKGDFKATEPIYSLFEMAGISCAENDC